MMTEANLGIYSTTCNFDADITHGMEKFYKNLNYVTTCNILCGKKTTRHAICSSLAKIDRHLCRSEDAYLLIA